MSIGRAVIISCAAAVMLAGCGTDHSLPPSLPPPTNEQISQMNNDELCEISQKYVDPRLEAEESKRKLNCDPAFQYCQKNGVAAQHMAQCVADRHTWLNKMAEPSYAFCANSGFKDGTEGMATCLVSERRREIQQAYIYQMQKLQQQQQQLIIDRMNRPVSTNCTGFGNTVNCTSY